jgi:hypothetical protein
MDIDQTINQTNTEEIEVGTVQSGDSFGNQKANI